MDDDAPPEAVEPEEDTESGRLPPAPAYFGDCQPRYYQEQPHLAVED